MRQTDERPQLLWTAESLSCLIDPLSSTLFKLTMKREVSRDKYLPAFALNIDDLEILLSRLLTLFNEVDTIYTSIKPDLRRETLIFKNVEEIRENNGLRGQIKNFSLYLSQDDKSILVRSGWLLDSRPSVSTSSSNEAWCAGAVETISSFFQSKHQWYFWFVSWAIGPISIAFSSIPLLAKVLLPRAFHLQGLALYSWTLLVIVLMFLYLAKDSLLPSASIIITQEDSFLRRHSGELSLLVAIVTVILTVIGMVT